MRDFENSPMTIERRSWDSGRSAFTWTRESSRSRDHVPCRDSNFEYQEQDAAEEYIHVHQFARLVLYFGPLEIVGTTRETGMLDDGQAIEVPELLEVKLPNDGYRHHVCRSAAGNQ